MNHVQEEIERLEGILREKDDSPVFARLASLYLEKNDYDRALELCNHGTERFSGFATGFLIRAIVFEELKRYQDSIDDYRRVKELLPRSLVADERISALQEKLKLSGKEKSPETVTDIEVEKIDTPEAEHDKHIIEDLAERLKEYKPRSQKKALTDIELEEPDEEEEPLGSELLIVTETLATIFFKQKQYQRAIEAYNRLIERHPDKKDQYLTRIAEIAEAKKNAESN